MVARFAQGQARAAHEPVAARLDRIAVDGRRR